MTDHDGIGSTEGFPLSERLGGSLGRERNLAGERHGDSLEVAAGAHLRVGRHQQIDNPGRNHQTQEKRHHHDLHGLRGDREYS